MSSIQTLLSRMDKVYDRGDGKWMACCPAHDDKSPSLSIRHLHHGRILIYCFAGCGVGDVLAAIGLSLKDLFQDSLISIGDVHRSKGLPAWKIKKYQEALQHEQLVWDISRVDISQGKPLSPEGMKRAKRAASRIFQITEVLSNW